MSGSVCALGHPLPESLQLCNVCGLGRLPEAPGPRSFAPDGSFASEGAAPATATLQAPAPLAPPGSPYPFPGGPPAVYQPGAYAGSGSSPSRRWIIAGVVAAVAAVGALGGLAWWKHRPAHSATGAAQADGSTVVNSRGIHVVTPAGWTVVSTTPAALAKASETFAQSNPQLAAAAHALQSQQGNNALRFVAYSRSVADGFASNANVLVTNSPVPLDEEVSASAGYLTSAGATHMHESPLTSNTGSGEELTYLLPLKLQTGSVTLHVEQVYESKGSEVGILTLESTQPSDPAFPGIISSFGLT